MLSSDLRPRHFAMVELFLDLAYIGQSLTGVDLDSLLIMACAAEATMHPFVLDPKTPANILHAKLPPEELRGSISRMEIADRTGLPRETVRRKVAALVSSGQLIEDKQRRIRAPRNLSEAKYKKAADEAFAAVQRYDARLRGLGCRGVAAHPERQKSRGSR